MAMESTARRLEFAPPPAPGMVSAMILAILAHLVLLAVLTVGVQWKRESVPQTVEAELWSAIPVQAAPPAPEPEPELPKPAPPEIKPEPKPDPGPTPAEIKAQADIAIAKEKEKEKAKQQKEKQLALEKAELEKKKLAELEKQKQAKLEQDKKDKAKQDKLKKEQADKLAADKEKAQHKQDQLAEAVATKAREDQMKRTLQLAGGDGKGNTPGGVSGVQSSGPSASYAGRIQARIKPNITYPDNINGNPRVEVEIRTSPSGTILSARITQSSGVKSWDEAITRAIEKTEILPKDEDGRIPNPMLIGFRPKD
jgi:colicin import membrane protein